MKYVSTPKLIFSWFQEPEKDKNGSLNHREFPYKSGKLYSNYRLRPFNRSPFITWKETPSEINGIVRVFFNDKNLLNSWPTFGSYFVDNEGEYVGELYFSKENIVDVMEFSQRFSCPCLSFIEIKKSKIKSKGPSIEINNMPDFSVIEEILYSLNSGLRKTKPKYL